MTSCSDTHVKQGTSTKADLPLYVYMGAYLHCIIDSESLNECVPRGNGALCRLVSIKLRTILLLTNGNICMKRAGMCNSYWMGWSRACAKKPQHIIDKERAIKELKKNNKKLGKWGGKQSIKEDTLTLTSLEAKLKRIWKTKGSQWNLNNLDQI